MSRNISPNKLPAWSAVAIEKLCSTINPENSSSARVTFSLSLFVAVDDAQSVSEQLNLRNFTLDLCFGVSRCLLMSFSPAYSIPKSFEHVVQKANLSTLRDFLTQLYFIANSSLNETKYFFFLAFVDLSFSPTILLFKIKEGIKIHSAN